MIVNRYILESRGVDNTLVEKMQLLARDYNIKQDKMVKDNVGRFHSTPHFCLEKLIQVQEYRISILPERYVKYNKNLLSKFKGIYDEICNNSDKQFTVCQ